MPAGLEQVAAHRVWFVPSFVVWGLPGLDDIDLLVVERTAGVDTIGFSSITIAGASQDVLYADLTDHRGNQLPGSLAAPRVLTRTHEPMQAFVVGTEATTSFRIARDPDAPGPLVADLMVVEMGD